MQYVMPSDAPAGAGGPGERRRGRLLGVLVFLVCFVGTCWWIRTELGRPDSLLAAKLDLYEEDPEGYDLVFLGPSTVYRQCEPLVFDAALAAAGHPLRSFNLGAPAMGGLEIRFALRQLLDADARRHDGRLRWVLVDLQLMDVEVHETNLLTSRVTWWHDLATTARAVTMILDVGAGLLPTGQLLADHLRACLYNLSNLGRVRMRLQGLLEGTAEERLARDAADARRAQWELGPLRDGFCSLDDALRLGDEEARQALRARRTGLMDRVDEYRTKAAAKARRGGARRPLRETEAELFRDLQRLAAERGVGLVFITSPGVDARSDLPLAAHEAGLLPRFIDVTNPREHKPLYALAHRFDWNHLNGAGARIYTEHLAERFLEMLAEDPRPVPDTAPAAAGGGSAADGEPDR